MFHFLMEKLLDLPKISPSGDAQLIEQVLQAELQEKIKILLAPC